MQLKLELEVVLATIFNLYSDK